jgi:hypothetical protein
MVRNGDRFFISNDRGELIIARLAPDGYHEISRTSLIKPTSRAIEPSRAGRRQLDAPGICQSTSVTRNDEEMIAVSLAVDDYK